MGVGRSESAAFLQVKWRTRCSGGRATGSQSSRSGICPVRGPRSGCRRAPLPARRSGRSSQNRSCPLYRNRRRRDAHPREGHSPSFRWNQSWAPRPDDLQCQVGPGTQSLSIFSRLHVFSPNGPIARYYAKISPPYPSRTQIDPQPGMMGSTICDGLLAL